MSFEWIDQRGLKFLAYSPWRDEGILHGFSARIVGADGQQESDYLSSALQLKRVFFLNQVHGAELIDLRDGMTAEVGQPDLPRGDGFVISRPKSAQTSSSVQPLQAVAVCTADCMPVMVMGAESLALVHVGWRGLVLGIVQKAISVVKSTESELEVIIGPCAGAQSYEVGQEVISALGDCAEWKHCGGKYLLSLAGTVSNIVTASVEMIRGIHYCGVCTITDPNFHSYRREGSKSGRNWSFVMLG